jgi:hypothetical protein
LPQDDPPALTRLLRSRTRCAARTCRAASTRPPGCSAPPAAGSTSCGGTSAPSNGSAPIATTAKDCAWTGPSRDAFRATETVTTADGTRLWVPLVDGTERLGALEVLTDGPEAADVLRGPVLAFAALVASLVVSKGQYTDTYERVRRALPMGIPAEMLWRQLPPLAFAADRFVVTAQLEP